MSKLGHKVIKPTSIGGQAVIEGVMMRGPKDIAIAVRTPENEIVVKKEPVEGIITKYRLNKIPFLRGGLALIDSMVLGIKSLNYAVSIADVCPFSSLSPLSARKDITFWTLTIIL
jgi:uncharacterized protein YqhQ